MAVEGILVSATIFDSELLLRGLGGAPVPVLSNWQGERPCVPAENCRCSESGRASWMHDREAPCSKSNAFCADFAEVTRN